MVNLATIGATVAASPPITPTADAVFSAYTYTGSYIPQLLPTIPYVSSTGSFSANYFPTPSTSSQGAIIGSVVDSSGNIYAIGYLNTSGGPFPAYVSKMNSSGIQQWQRVLNNSNGTTYGTTVNRIKFDSSGNIWVSGTFNTASFNNGFIIELDVSGTTLLNKTFTYSNNVSVLDFVFDGSGNIYALTQTFGATVQSTLTAMNSSATVSWQSTLSNSSNPVNPNGICIDSSANIYICGTYNGVGVLAKYNSSGTLQYQRQITTMVSSNGISIDASGNLYVIGIGTGSTAVIIASITQTGSVNWGYSYTNTNSSSMNLTTGRNTVDASGNIYISAYTYISSAYQTTICKIDNTGNFIWGLQTLSGGEAQAYQISLDSSNNVYSAILGNDSVTGLDSGFILKINQSQLPNNSQLVGSPIMLITAPINKATVSISVSASSMTVSASGSSVSTGTITIATTPVITPILLNSNAAGTTQNNGGLVWFKSRSAATDNLLYDSVRGGNSTQSSNHASVSTTVNNNDCVVFGPNGLILGRDGDSTGFNVSGQTYVAWNFARRAKFMDIVKYTGNGTTQALSHSLGIAPGMILVKSLTSSVDWSVYHASASGYNLLNGSFAWQADSSGTNFGNNTVPVAPTTTTFTVGNSTNTNANGQTYIAYLFANDSSTSGLIQTGSFTTNSSGVATVTLGWEPQFILAKCSNTTQDWYLLDTTRGMSLTTGAALRADTTAVESAAGSVVQPTATGFTVTAGLFGNSNTIVYMAIRRSMSSPTSGTQVFMPFYRSGTAATANLVSGFAPDLFLTRLRTSGTNGSSGSFNFYDRLRGTSQIISTSPGTGTETVNSQGAGGLTSFNQNGITVGNDSSKTDINYQTGTVTFAQYLLRRATGFFDIVAWTGTGSSQSVTHNLGVAPELVLIKDRTSGSAGWFVYHKNLTNNLVLNSSAAMGASPTFSGAPTATTFQTSLTITNADKYIAYLFASVSGVSKIGTFTGDGTSASSNLINCGFSPRFIMIKAYSTTGDWWVFDSARGITTGNDAGLQVDATAYEVSTVDNVAPNAAGFYVNQNSTTNLNTSSVNYIYLAIA